MKNKTVFIFRRDLRLIDNKGLMESYSFSDKILPIFIFTPEQIDKNKNKYFSNNSVQFLVESLIDLNKELNKKKSRLFIFYGNTIDVLKKIKKEYDYQHIVVNEDYTPYSIERDNNIKKVCDELNVKFHSYMDLLLLPIDKPLNKQGNPYQIFTPFYNKAVKYQVDKPNKNIKNKYEKSSLTLKCEYNKNINLFYDENKDILERGGRTHGLKKLKNIKNLKNYEKEREYPSKETSQLSAMNKYGCLSIREVYWEIKKYNIEKLLRQLYWRDFYYRVTYYNPRVLKGKSYLKDYDKIKWKKNKEYLKKWKEGSTGFPIVDAGMRQMNKTGYMHNRLRMIVSHFLIKDLFIDWREGERYFAQTLYDYDPSQNNGGWQGSAGSGMGAQPYFRTFNPWTQSKKYDNKCLYIKKWVPELKEVKNEHIHKWNDYYDKYPEINYPKPLVDHKLSVKKSLQLYRSFLFD